MKSTLYFLLISFFIFSCKDDEFLGENINPPIETVTDEQFAQNNFGTNISANFIGRIVNENGRALKDVQITIGNSITSTDHNGVFVLNNASVYEKFALVKATKTGYIQGSRALVPSATGTNDVQIILLEKNIIGNVSSGSTSQVSLPNGSKVEFQGDFIDLNGNPYTGQVDVSLHYLEPNEETTLSQMPGMLFGKRENGVASAMETYGMLAVNLYTSSGDKLNIAESSPATLTFPVSTSTPNAPEMIALWYFDEEVGFWKEQGIATKVGNEYKAEVNHFTWWNCDLPLEYITACFTVLGQDQLTNVEIEIIRNSSNQTIYSGYTNDIGGECGLFPKNEEVTINIYSGCSDSLIHSVTEGPFTTDAAFEINITSLDIEMIETTLFGTINNCSGNPITNGYLLVLNDSSSNFSNHEMITITDGTINNSFVYCDGDTYSFMVFDLDTNKASEIIPLNLDPSVINIGTITTCEQTSGTFVGNVNLLTQEEVNTFGLFGYEIIDGGFTIGDISGSETNISSLEPLNTINEVTGNLSLFYNPMLTSVNGLENVTNIGGTFQLLDNNSLTSLEAMESLVSIGVNMQIFSCDSLTSLGFANLSSVGGSITISNFDSLISLQGLENLVSVGGNLQISACASLTSLQGIENLVSVGGFLQIDSCASLTSLQGLENLVSVGGNLQISACESLTSLQGLENLISADEVNIGTNSTLANSPNPILTDFCGISNLLINGAYGVVNIANNAYNPTVADIQAGNCSN